MIKTVEFVPTSKANNSELSEKIETLWPPKKKAIRIEPDFQIKEYFFRVITRRECEELKITINGFEDINLNLINEENNQFTYKSETLSARSYLGFNLGLFELHLHSELEVYPLATINNKLSKQTNKELNYMYENVANSDFFNLYIINFYRANSLANEIPSNNPNKHFWLSIAVATELIREVNRFFTGELEFTHRIDKKSFVRKYNSNSVVEESGIDWLMDHPEELTQSSMGPVSINGLKYQLEYINQTVMCLDYDTYENRLLISCFYSIQNVLSELCNEYLNTRLFPHKSIQRIIAETGSTIKKLNVSLNLTPPYNTLPEFSNKFIDDTRYNKLFELISRWYSVNNLTFGNKIRSPILGITTIFEHYCFIKIIECLKIKGFILNEAKFKSLDEAGSVELIKDDEIISIYYEPSIHTSSASPLITSKLTSYYTPDIVIVYKNIDDIKCGVIDSKFSTPEIIKKVLAPKIYYKYGLFLHRPDNKALDYVFAMYPDSHNKSKVTYSRNASLINEITPSLGFFSIPFNDNASNNIAEFIIQLLTIEKV